jgi:transglutaminase-like putative cysteine protease
MTTLNIALDLEYTATGEADYIFNIEAAFHPGQQIIHEKLTVEPCTLVTCGLDPTGHNRLTKVNGSAGIITLHYAATVAVNYQLPTETEEEIPISQLPVDVVPYIWSSRYCESDAVSQMVQRTFGNNPKGFQRVTAICQWIRDNITYQLGSTSATTSAREVLVNRAGVCRDFAHLGVTFCRALNIPARFVTGYTWYETPPPDFHAVFEAYLGGRWLLFDPTQLAPVTDLVRIATGKDASETAFATIFGPVQMTRMVPAAEVAREVQPEAKKPGHQPILRRVGGPA